MLNRLENDSVESHDADKSGENTQTSADDARYFPVIKENQTAACGNTADTSECKEATYGGFQYRWHYDEYQRTLENKRRRANHTGLRVFAIVVTVVFFVCFMTLGTILIVNYYVQNANKEPVRSVGGEVSANPENIQFDDTSAESISGVSPTVGIMPYDDGGGAILSIPEIADAVKPSVVGITVENVLGKSVATGIILTSDGYIVTNNHVVADNIRKTALAGSEIVSNDSKFKVYLYGGGEYDAQLIGGDQLTDLAVIKIDASDLTAAVLGDSDKLVVGEPVVAIGTPAGIAFAGTVTDGIVSAINRDIPIYDDTGKVVKTMTVIQTNANINPGNSGGPLVGSRGQVIGINTMKLAGSYEGIGFALPISGAIPIINDLIENGRITQRPDGAFVRERARIGITCENVDKDTSVLYRIPMGVMVKYIDQDTDAYAGGLAIGDIIVNLNGEMIETVDDIDSQLDKFIPGEKVTVQIYRSGRYYDIEFELGAFS